MKESKYEIGDRVTVYVLGHEWQATVTNILEEGTEVELDKPFRVNKLTSGAYNAYSNSTACFNKFLIKSESLIEKNKGGIKDE